MEINYCKTFTHNKAINPKKDKKEHYTAQNIAKNAV